MKRVILLASLTLLLGFTAGAQSVKIGYIDSRALLSQMPEMVKADKDLEALAKTYQDQLEAMNNEFEKKATEYQAGEKTMSDAMKEVKRKELQDLQARFESTQRTAEDKVSAKKEELYKPILEKADNAIKAVAKEKGYDYVFDAAAGLLYATEKDNMLADVKAKLGIK